MIHGSALGLASLWDVRGNGRLATRQCQPETVVFLPKMTPWTLARFPGGEEEEAARQECVAFDGHTRVISMCFTPKGLKTSPILGPLSSFE